MSEAETNVKTRLNQTEQEVRRDANTVSGLSAHLLRQANAYASEEVLQAQTEAQNFRQRQSLYAKLMRENPGYLNALWLDEMTRIYAAMREAGRIDLLDHYLSSEGITITQFPLQPRPK